MNRKKRKEAGAIAIEAVLSLTIFMLAILALMMGSLLIRAQASMQYALNQTAKEISGYFYLLDKFGIASAVSGNATLSAQAKVQPLNDSIGEIVAFTGNVKKTSGEYKQIVENAKNGNLTDEEIERIKNLPDDATTLKNEAKEIAGHLKDLTDDPKRLFSGVFQVFGKAMINTALSKYVTPFVCEALMPKYLTLNKNSSAFYENTGIIESSIDFDGSQMLADGRTISLVVTYEVDASKLTLGFYKKHLKFQQIASTCAWIRGNDSESLYSLEQVNQLFQEGRIKAEADRRRALDEKEKAEEEERKKKEAEYSSELDEHKADETSKPEKEEEEESSDSEVSSEDIKKFLEQHPECQELYDNYGADVIKAVNKCSDPNAAITLLLNAEKGKPAYGKEAVAALKKGGDDAVAALNKVPSKECAQVVAANGSRAAVIIAANGKDAVTAIGSNDSPIDAIKAIERATDKKTVIQALNLAPTQDCAVAIMRCKDATAAEAIIAVGKDRAVEAADAINNSEDLQSTADAIKKLKGDALDVFKKVGTSKLCTDVLKTDGFEAAYILTNYSENGLQLYKNGLSTDQIVSLESHGLTPDVFAGRGNRHVNNAEEAEKLLASYSEIHRDFTEKEIQNLKDNVVAMEQYYKETMQADKIGPAVAGVYNRKTGQFYYSLNALKPLDKDGKEIKSAEAPPPSDGVEYIDNIIKNMPDDVKESYKATKGAGSHAEVYAVSAALADGADIDDLLVYVNATEIKGKTVPDATYDPFVTCKHCEYILSQLKVLSNVEI